MPKIPTPLTDSKIANSKPKKDDYVLVDGNGLRLLVKKNGLKIWEFIYSSPTQTEKRKTLIKDDNKNDVLDGNGNKTYNITIAPKRRKKSLGNYLQKDNFKEIEKEKEKLSFDTLTDLEILNLKNVSLATARKIRTKYIQLVKSGIDVIEYHKELEIKESAKDSELFENVVNEWFTTNQKKKLVEETYDRKYQVFVSSVLPYFENRYIKNITKTELETLLKEKEKTARETASRLYNYLFNLWEFATNKEYCISNPFKKMVKSNILLEKKVTRNYEKITDEETFKELVNEIYNNTKIVPSMKNALKFVIHIPLRANNLCNLKWSHIDFDKKLLTIPRDEMKIKDVNLPDFKLPLTDEVINILNNQKEFCTKYTELKEYVFIGNDNINPINKESPNRALTRMGFTAKKKQSLHSFRGSFRTIADEKFQEHNTRDVVMESVLDHYKLTQVEKAYLNKVSYLPQQKPLLEWWSNYIVNLLNK